MRTIRLLSFLTVATLPLAACSKSGSSTASTSAPAAVTNTADLTPERATQKAPDVFKVRFTTTKGDIVTECHREWAPNGADRLYNLVKLGYYTDIGIYRVVDNFMMQFGIHGDPAVSARWRDARIADDPQVVSNQRGFVTFAKGGPNSRTTQLFINFENNERLDPMGFPPVCRVIEGMNVVDSIFKVGEGAPGGPGPSQGRIQMEGNAYLKKDFPKLDYIKSAKLE